MTSLLLTLVMLLSLVPAMGVTASAAEPVWETVNNYADLKAAVAAKKEYIKLGTDIDTTNFHSAGSGLEVEDWLTFKNQTCTLDLNGKTLTLMTRLLPMGVFLRVYDGSNLTIKDSSHAKTGAITGAFKNYIASDAGCCLFHVHGGSSLTLENGSFTVTSEPHESNADTVRAMDSNITIKEGVTISHPGKFYPEHSYKDLDGNSYALRTDGKCKVVIDGGVFDGHVKLSGYQDTNGSIQINKGTFKKDVQVLYTAEENNSNPAVTVNGGTFEGNVYLQYWPWKTSLYMPYRLNGGTFKGTVNLHTDSDIYEKDKPTGNPNIALGLDKCFGYSAVVAPAADTFVGPNAYTAVILEKLDHSGKKCYKMLLEGNASDPVQIIGDAWGIIDVKLDTNVIDYAKDFKGEVKEITNDTEHTLTFTWKDLAPELRAAGYSYDAKCERYVPGATSTPTNFIPDGTEYYTYTFLKDADPTLYSFALHLNLKKDGSFVGIMHNEHIVKLVVNQAAPVEPVPTLDGTVYYTSGIVYDRPISISAMGIPEGATPAYQWQRSKDGGDTWENINGETSSRYTPVAADMGENVRIRVKITANGYLGEIVGAAVKVSKADNNGYPAVIQLEAVKDSTGKYNGFKITNFDSDCEYVYTTSDPTSGNEWPDSSMEIDSNSNTVTGLASDTTYYVFARFKGTNTHTVGSIVSKNSIGLFDTVYLQHVLLEGYNSGETIYIERGKSVELKVSADPSNANSWNEITFKDDNGGAASNIAISNAKIDASGTTPTAFPNGHSITIKGVSKGSETLKASYPGTNNYYGSWNVVVYDDSTVANALRLENVYTYADITLSENDEAELPTDLPTLLPANSGYHLEWRILKRGTYGATYVTENDNIKLEDGKIKPKAAHAASEKAQLELVAVKDGSTEYKTLPKTSLFYVTVTAAPVIELTGLTVAPAKVNLELNATYQLSAVKEPVNATGSLTWASDKPEVAEVDTTGKVTAKAQGTAIITVTCGTKSASCTVTVGHTHDTDAQPWVYMDPGTHTKTCTAGDDFKVEAHDFNAWTKVDDTNHSRTCSKCKKSGETANYTETANHNWQWKVDTAATPNADGKQHEECVDCHAKRSENTVIPMLTSIMAEHLTVAKPVKDAAAAMATTTDSSYTVANTEWMAADGTPLAIGGKFQPGTVYTVKITLETAGAGVFSVKSTYNTIEGKTATVSPALTGDNHADSVILTYTFDKTAGGYHPGTGTGTGTTTYPITVKSAKNGDVTASHKSASKGTTVTLTVDPDKGYVLDTLTVLDGKDKEIKLTEKNGKYTFTMPASKVTVEAMFKASAPTGKNPFIDVPAGSYYEDAVIWAVEKGITSGTSAVTFDPNGNCTRAQAVTFLWRAAGSPAPKTKVMPFTDVPSGSYYYDAVLWAMEQGITKGTSDTAFSPNASCTRAQIVTFLWRANGSPVVSGNSAFTDVASDAYYAAAVTWAEKNGVTGGIGNGLFGSNNNCTRAQIVTFLYRAMK